MLIIKKSLVLLLALSLVGINIDAKEPSTKNKNLDDLIVSVGELDDSQDQVRAACYPSSTECDGITSTLTTIINSFDSCCTSLQSTLSLIVPYVNDLESCDRSTPISQVDLPFTVTLSGSYCLTETVVVGDGLVGITIDADDVLLNLNNFNMEGGLSAVSVNGHSNIIIMSGSIEETTGNAVEIISCNNVRVYDITTRLCSVGLSCDDINGLVVSGLSCRANTDAGYRFINGTRNGQISSCISLETLNAINLGYDIDATQSLTFSNCSCLNDVVNSSTVTGFNVSNGATNCVFDACSVINTNGTGTGFLFNTVTDCICNGCFVSNNPGLDPVHALDGFVVTGTSLKVSCLDCSALGNQMLSTGYRLENAEDCSIVNSLAKNNGEDGFSVLDSTNCYLRGNTAIGNIASGYSLTGTGDTVFLGNYGEGNSPNWSVSTDYAPTFTLSISGGTLTAVSPRTAPATQWDNIDVVA